MEIPGNPRKSQNSQLFCCDKCDYVTCHRNDFNKHKSSLKHNYGNNGNPAEIAGTRRKSQNSQHHKCFFCDKKYSTNSGLWKHSQKCKLKQQVGPNFDFHSVPDENIIIELSSSKEKQMTSTPISEVTQITSMFVDTIKQNQELQKQNQELQKQMMDMMKTNMITNSHNNSHSHNTINSNNKFNLQFFLNETCKDAMNLTDFIDSIKVKLTDLEYTGENGYAAGVTNIILRELKQLDVCKRPIHCSDAKREVFHIKNDNEWEKERDLLVKTIKQTTRKSIYLLAEWREKHPGCMEYDNVRNDQYMRINGEVLGPYEDEVELKDFNKIIANMAKATMIDKK